MGMLIEGRWVYEDDEVEDGAFRRETTTFRNWITRDGASGETGEGGFKAESGRYHLYVSYACPWAHRTILYRALKGLENHIGMSVVSPYLGDDSWSFQTDVEGTTGDPVSNASFLRELYIAARPDMTGRVSVPVLWDKQRQTIVSNESAEIIRMFDGAFGEVTGIGPEYRPTELIAQINEVNLRVFRTVNNGVYRAGFATKQEPYNQAVEELFRSLDWLEDALSVQPYLVGDKLTEADWRLFTTAVRFDHVYHGLFKCNWRQLADYPAISRWMVDLLGRPGVADTVRLDHIVPHYWWSLHWINPTRIVPKGPVGVLSQVA
ncbi:MAG: glutathione S-transferase family protein [Devosiaceae bacterium]|nr:glutathione S-transferase family protein [Devosiaceae bacterium MH13]